MVDHVQYRWTSLSGPERTCGVDGAEPTETPNLELFGDIRLSEYRTIHLQHVACATTGRRKVVPPCNATVDEPAHRVAGDWGSRAVDIRVVDPRSDLLVHIGRVHPVLFPVNQAALGNV